MTTAPAVILAGLLPTPLANKLTVTRTLGSQIVALTADEREQILSAIERNPANSTTTCAISYSATP